MSTMKRMTVVATLAVSLLGVVPAASADEVKIGVVDTFKVMESSPQAESAKKTLEKEFSARQRTLTDQMKSIKDMEDKLDKDGAVMSEGEVGKMRRDIAAKRRDLQRDRDEMGDDFNLRKNELQAKIGKEIIAVIQQVAKEKGLDLVLGQGVIYANDKVDLTAAVIERLKKSGSGGDETK